MTFAVVISLAYGKECLPGKAEYSQHGALTGSPSHVEVSGKESHLGHLTELTLCLTASDQVSD